MVNTNLLTCQIIVVFSHGSCAAIHLHCIGCCIFRFQITQNSLYKLFETLAYKEFDIFNVNFQEQLWLFGYTYQPSFNYPIAIGNVGLSAS